MTRLFRHADPDMPEEKKVCVLIRGVKQEVFAGLIRNPPNTVQEFVAEATTIAKTLDMRTRQCNGCLMPDCAAAQAIDSEALRETIRAIVWEELRKLLPSAQPQEDSITDIMWEVQQSLRIP